MNSIDKKHNYFYKITNLVNGKYYYGIHSTDNLNDGYMGSSNLVSESIKKYGKENFIKEIIEDYPTGKEASDHEKRIVDINLIEDRMCYNLRAGGDNENHLSVESRQKLSDYMKGRFVGEDNHFYGRKHSEESKKKCGEKNVGRKLTEEHKIRISNALSGDKHPLYGVTGIDNPNFGRKHSEQFCKDISERQTGCGNSFYGRKHSAESKSKMSQPGELNPFYGRKHSEESRKMMSINGSSCKECVIDGIYYHSVKSVMESFNLSRSCVSERLSKDNKEFPNWNYLIDINQSLP